jgi:hypothetical protein
MRDKQADKNGLAGCPTPACISPIPFSGSRGEAPTGRTQHAPASPGQVVRCWPHYVTILLPGGKTTGGQEVVVKLNFLL